MAITNATLRNRAQWANIYVVYWPYGGGWYYWAEGQYPDGPYATEREALLDAVGTVELVPTRHQALQHVH